MTIRSILIQDKVVTGLQKKYGLSETAARKIVDGLMHDIEDMAAHGANLIDIANHLIETEHFIADYQKKLDFLEDISNCITAFAR